MKKIKQYSGVAEFEKDQEFGLLKGKEILSVTPVKREVVDLLVMYEESDQEKPIEDRKVSEVHVDVDGVENAATCVRKTCPNKDKKFPVHGMIKSKMGLLCSTRCYKTEYARVHYSGKQKRSESKTPTAWPSDTKINEDLLKTTTRSFMPKRLAEETSAKLVENGIRLTKEVLNINLTAEESTSTVKKSPGKGNPHPKKNEKFSGGATLKYQPTPEFAICCNPKCPKRDGKFVKATGRGRTINGKKYFGCSWSCLDAVAPLKATI